MVESAAALVVLGYIEGVWVSRTWDGPATE